MLLLERESLKYYSIINHLNNLSPGRQDSFVRPEPAAQRLERLRKERQNQIKCKNIQWKERSSSQSADDLSSLFEKKDFKDRPRSTGSKSTLSLRLEQCPQQLNNPFNEYSKFDGKGHVGTTATKKIDVYLSMQSTQEKIHPMTVVTMANARVHDLIGLICWQYTCEGREPKLIENVNTYCLHIAEDDGEVDTDFPPLDSNEPIHKFGFSTLALVEKYSSPGLGPKQSLFVRIEESNKIRYRSKLSAVGWYSELSGSAACSLHERTTDVALQDPGRELSQCLALSGPSGPATSSAGSPA
ncbi:Target of rapamycin complex 2 subunit MAPKAP1 [Anabarilius grahami]|uniref:Target of rapamycin complex 2 subunit MAPKAP1 n=1 Tax=Anabarilius grahami TaxID=495550 RepID=A0A3N0Z6A8_ANAGA|nr:Target of rapamycin complex 2 subunit MAPKAP1 [Anabarilius grahami]